MKEPTTVAGMWEFFSMHHLCQCVTAEQREVFRNIFYAGFISFDSITGLIAQLPNEEAKPKLQMIRHELLFHLKSLPDNLKFHGDDL